MSKLSIKRILEKLEIKAKQIKSTQTYDKW